MLIISNRKISMLIIRLSRVGKRNHPQYKLVVAEKTAPVKGRFVEQLGSYDPHQKIAVIKAERVQYWISKGAACSDTAWNLLVSKEVIKGEKRKVKLPEKVKSEETEETEAKKAGAETPKTEGAEKAEEKKEKVEDAAVKEEVKEEAKNETKTDEKKQEPAKEEVKAEEKKTEMPKEEVVGEEKKAE